LAGTTQTLTITNPDCQSTTTSYTLPVGCVPLPVRWLSFTGREMSKKVVLNWATASEYNNKYFVVEKSTNGGTNFVEIGRLNSKGDNGNSYDFWDNDPAAVNYYRLRQVDNDGKSTYSEIVLVKIQGKFSFTAYPNPANQQIMIEYNDTYRGGQVSLLNSTGKRVFTQTLTGFNKVSLDVSSMAAGVYVVEIVTATGKKQQQKILIERLEP
jgi:hypothetical protein